jgi:hypothetical protein
MMRNKRATANPVAAIPAAMRQPIRTFSKRERWRVWMKVIGSSERTRSDAIVKP